MFVTADCENSQKFFNVSSDEHLSTSSVKMDGSKEPLPVQECDDLTVSKKSVSVELVKLKSQETAVKWKDENAIKLLIKLWQDHESLFKSSTMKNVEV